MKGNPILELNSAAAAIPFEIHTMEWIEQNRVDYHDIPHRHNYYTIIWVRKGKGTHLLDLDSFSIEDNSVYCVSPGQVHHLQVEGPVDGYVISFTTDFIGLAADNFMLLYESGLFNIYGHAPVIKLSLETESEMLEVIDKLVREYTNFFLLRAEILRGFLKIFLIYLTRNFGLPAQPKYQTRIYESVNQFFSLVNKDFATRKMVSDYAAELAVTPNYLNELVKKITGHPASYHIQQRIVLEAKRMLRFSGLTMKEIAYELGFDDPAHFSKFFKKVSGTNFTDYKLEQERKG